MPHTPMKGRSGMAAAARYMGAVVWVKSKGGKINKQASAARYRANKYREQRKFGYMPQYRKGVGSTYKMPYNWMHDTDKRQRATNRKEAGKSREATARAASRAAFRASMKTRTKKK